MNMGPALLTGALAGGGCYRLVRCRPFLGMAGPPSAGGISPDLDTVHRAEGELPPWRQCAAGLGALAGFGLGFAPTIANQ